MTKKSYLWALLFVIRRICIQLIGGLSCGLIVLWVQPNSKGFAATFVTFLGSLATVWIWDTFTGELRRNNV